MSWYFYKTDVNFNSGLRVWPLSHGAYRLLHTYYAIARQAARPGHVEVAEGREPTAEDVCRLAGAGFTPGDIPGYDAELAAAGHLRRVTSVWYVTDWKLTQSPPSQTPEGNRIRQQNYRQKHQIPPHVTTDVTSHDVTTRRSRSRSRSRIKKETQITTTAAPRPKSDASRSVEAAEGRTESARTPTSIQRVVEAYKTARGLASDPAQDRVLFPRFARAAKQLLAMAGGDVAVAETAMREIGGVLAGKGLDWRLDTVVREYPEWAKDTGHNGRPS